MPGVVRFYKDNEGWCSGTLLLRGIVLTAAHCLFANRTDGDGLYGYFPTTSLVVTPGNYADLTGRGRAPYGNWEVANAWVPQGWADEDGGLDWGLVALKPDASGNYAGDYTGTYAAQWNAQIPVGAQFFKVGYPYTGPFRTASWYFGHGQYFCDVSWDGDHGNNWAYTISSFNLWLGPCEMNGGSSGGPVFVRFTDGSWKIVGVNNRGYDRADGYGATGVSFWFDERFGQFWNSVINPSGASARARPGAAAVGALSWRRSAHR
jgi:trypsin